MWKLQRDVLIDEARPTLTDVAEASGHSVEQLLGFARKWRISSARQEAMRLLRDAGGWTYPDLAVLFERDHSTIIHGVRAARSRLVHRAMVPAAVVTYRLKGVPGHMRRQFRRLEEAARYVEKLDRGEYELLWVRLSWASGKEEE